MNDTTFDNAYTDVGEAGGPTQGDLKNRACERELDVLMGLPAPLTLGNSFMGLTAPLNTGRPELIIEQNTTAGSELNNQQEASDAFLGSTAPLNTG